MSVDDQSKQAKQHDLEETKEETAQRLTAAQVKSLADRLRLAEKTFATHGKRLTREQRRSASTYLRSRMERLLDRIEDEDTAVEFTYLNLPEDW